MDELSEYLAKNEPKEGMILMLEGRMKNLIELLYHMRKTPKIERLCDVFLDEFYEACESIGIDL